MAERYKPSVYPTLKGETARYSTSEVAKIFGKTRQWVFYSLEHERFVDPKGKPIVIERPGAQQRYSWTSENIKHAAISCYKRRTLSREDLQDIIRDLVTEAGRLNGQYKIPAKKRVRKPREPKPPSPL